MGSNIFSCITFLIIVAKTYYSLQCDLFNCLLGNDSQKTVFHCNTILSIYKNTISQRLSLKYIVYSLSFILLDLFPTHHHFQPLACCTYLPSSPFPTLPQVSAALLSYQPCLQISVVSKLTLNVYTLN